MLHVKSQEKDTSSQGFGNDASVSTTTMNHHANNGEHHQVILSTAVVKVYDPRDNTHKQSFLLNSGSQSNFITSNLVKRLDLHQKESDMTIQK